jgi:hypothetical protein
MFTDVVRFLSSADGILFMTAVVVEMYMTMTYDDVLRLRSARVLHFSSGNTRCGIASALFTRMRRGLRHRNDVCIIPSATGAVTLLSARAQRHSEKKNFCNPVIGQRIQVLKSIRFTYSMFSVLC